MASAVGPSVASVLICRQLGGYDLKTIARRFKINYTRVSQIVGKVGAGVKSDKDIKELLRVLESDGWR